MIMRSRGGRGSHTILWWVEWAIIALSTFQFYVAMGQKSLIFRYGQFTYGGKELSFEVPGVPDANISEIHFADMHCFNGSMSQSDLLSFSIAPPDGHEAGMPGARTVSGGCLYNNPVQLLQPSNRSLNTRTVTSFSTMFQIKVMSALASNTWYALPPPGNVLEGVAFTITNYTAGSDTDLQNSNTGDLVSRVNSFVVELNIFHNPIMAYVRLSDYNYTSPGALVWDWGNGNGTFPQDAYNITVWIEYDGSTQVLQVFFSLDFLMKGRKGGSLLEPGISINVDLTEILSRGDMFIGFLGSVTNFSLALSPKYECFFEGPTVYMVTDWTFNSNGPAPDVQRDADGTVIASAPRTAEKKKRELVLPLVTTIPLSLLFLSLVFTIRILYRRNAHLIALAKKYEINGVMLRGGPQNFKHKALSTATKGFSPHELLGSGGFGSVYRGKLLLKGDQQPTDVAVKRIAANSDQGAREFLAEVKIIGQVQHRNLVRLLGWCHERGELLLVYDYMPNGSVDQHLFRNVEDRARGEPVLTWSRRLKIVSGVATALAYLHEEWEQRVIHRDVKSSNVMLDRDFNARLGDFGLARLSDHDQAPHSTMIAGTHGYLAPELAQTLQPTEKTDVYSFGAMVLEVATGKRPLLSKTDRESFDEILLVDWVWGLFRDGNLLGAADCALHNAYDPGEMIMFLKIGLLCSHPNPDERPDMRKVVNIWKGSIPFPDLPRSKPVPVFASSTYASDIDKDRDTTSTIFTGASGEADVSETRICARLSDGFVTLSFLSKDDGDSLPAEGKPKERPQGASPASTLRHRLSNTTSLPF